MVGGAMSEFMAGHAFALDARRIRLDEEGADALVSRRRVARGKDDSEICHIAIGDPDFLAIQHIRIILFARSGAEAGGVGACLRLRQAIATDSLTARQLRQIAATLLLAAPIADAARQI